jgi:hypothetical protein
MREIKKFKNITRDELIRHGKHMIRESARNCEYESGDVTRMESYGIPDEYRKRFYIFSNEISTGYYYQSTFHKGKILHSEYFSIKCKAFKKYVDVMNIETISDIKHFLNFLDDIITIKPDTLENWDKDGDIIVQENDFVNKEVTKICNRYIRQKKIKNILK